MTKFDAQQIGQQLFDAMMTCRPIAPLTDGFPDLSVDEAYQISLAYLAARQAQNGEAVVGKKIGVTSPVVQKMLGVFQPDFGFLTDAMECKDGRVSVAEHIALRAEAEIAFMLSKDLKGPGVTPEDVIEATAYVLPCFEIVDSRIANWQIKIQDTVADNASCGVFVLGDKKTDPRGLDLAALKVTVEKNGAPLSEGEASAVQGAPQNAVAWLANTLGDYGIPLKAGEVILSGSLVPLEPVVVGDKMTMAISELGSCSVEFV